jgi:hypothetical protein
MSEIEDREEGGRDEHVQDDLDLKEEAVSDSPPANTGGEHVLDKSASTLLSPSPTEPGVTVQAPLDIPTWRFWAIFMGVLFATFLFALGMYLSLSSTALCSSIRPTDPFDCHPEDY